MGFMLTSCGDSLKESVIKDVDAYFTKAEQTLASIETSEEFVDFALTMNDRSELMDQLNESYGDRTISDEDWNAIESYIEERATAYNQAEAEKCAEFLTPAIDRFEAIVNQMYPQYQEGTPFDEETLNEFLDAYFGVTAFTETRCHQLLLPEWMNSGLMKNKPNNVRSKPKRGRLFSRPLLFWVIGKLFCY